jgi:hypothetical protein
LVFLAVVREDTDTPIELVIYIGNDPTTLAEFKTAESSRLQGWVDIDLNVLMIFLKVAVTRAGGTLASARSASSVHPTRRTSTPECISFPLK